MEWFLEWRFGMTSDGSDQKISGKITMLHIFRAIYGEVWPVAVVVVLLFYVHGKHLRPCRDGQLT